MPKLHENGPKIDVSGLAAPLLRGESSDTPPLSPLPLSSGEERLAMRCAVAIVFTTTFLWGIVPGDAVMRSLKLVLATTARLGGDLGTISNLGHLVGGPIIAAVADTSSRTRAIAISVALVVSSKCLFAVVYVVSGRLAAGHAPAGSGDIAFLAIPFPILVLCGALIGDVTPTASRGAVFARLTVCHGVAAGVSQVLHLLLLRLYLTDYTPIIVAVLCEAPTPPATGKAAESAEAAGSAEERGPRAAVRLLLRERRLLCACVSTFVFIFGVHGGGSLMNSLTLALGWRQGDLYTLHLVITLPTSLTCITLASRFIFPRIGTAAAVIHGIACLLLMCLGFGVAPWLGAGAIGLSLFLIGCAAPGVPALLAVLTEQAPPRQLAMAQACLSVVATLAIGISTSVFGHLFDPSTPESAARPYALSLVLGTLGACPLLALLVPIAREQLRALRVGEGAGSE
ncbi:hypothetical protein EMIHUDRAFT_211951 [Emiliania huxleyi CCMP1516]|uniref:Major facilitator superfamily (MFS) profile domain-containing protein n=2 Tax=Emiliania huxleyi TaxID=2903 RepID=A0A0D3IRZ4_EMIH1|nr:hypothetical protein EMIHUDRAFT_211951 [Emiliania huxleyi CCMP1516]EOD14029.1 hypothetical protein EMIHUDRAFT_211951 [Emiliania huxleyi CCMP1516]|eukprot:XP_005766458.1 hypothetical protein EMIHUDRAFT_211951 [Emiliania huxleyi CCMP1516]